MLPPPPPEDEPDEELLLELLPLPPDPVEEDDDMMKIFVESSKNVVYATTEVKEIKKSIRNPNIRTKIFQKMLFFYDIPYRI